MPFAQMNCLHKKAKKSQLLVCAVMFALILLFLAHLTISSGQPANPRYSRGHWIKTPVNPEYDGVDERFLMEGKIIWPATEAPVQVLVTEEDQKLSTTPEPHLMKDQDSNKEAKESAVWKTVLVVAVLLVSVVGSLSMAYYLCVWRGGRIHYQPQKEGYP